MDGRPEPDVGSGYAGFAVYASVLTGLAGLVGAVVCAIVGQGDATGLVAMGVCLIASGLAFGLLANALLRR